MATWLLEPLLQWGLILGNLAITGLLGWRGWRLWRRPPPPRVELIQTINALLPQTQCGQCGHPGCRPYARAIAAGGPINRCPPGGERTIAALAHLLDRPRVPLDPELEPDPGPQVAVIRESECIGCTKCIQVCPVDAILGAPRLMHTVITAECTGCRLCLPPCPVDCIDMVDPTPAGVGRSLVVAPTRVHS